jgi:hypothetical protein
MTRTLSRTLSRITRKRFERIRSHFFYSCHGGPAFKEAESSGLLRSFDAVPAAQRRLVALSLLDFVRDHKEAIEAYNARDERWGDFRIVDPYREMLIDRACRIEPFST